MSDDGYDYDDEYDDEYYELYGEDIENLADDLVGTAYGHEPAYQPDTYDAYDSDYWDYDSGEDEYFDGPLNPNSTTTPSSPISATALTTDGLPIKTRPLTRMELEIRKAMKGKKFYGESPPPQRHPRKRRKVESLEKGIVSLSVAEGEVLPDQGDAVVEAENKPNISRILQPQAKKDLPTGVENLSKSRLPKSTRIPENHRQTTTASAAAPLTPMPLPILGTTKKPKNIEPVHKVQPAPKSKPTTTTTNGKKVPTSLKVDKTAETTGDPFDGNISPRKRKATPLSPLRK